jgi:hypothetical protein
MVILHIKKGDESQFLYETTCQAKLSELIPELIEIYNGRLKIERLNYGGFVVVLSEDKLLIIVLC